MHTYASLAFLDFPLLFVSGVLVDTSAEFSLTGGKLISREFSDLARRPRDESRKPSKSLLTIFFDGGFIL